MVAAVLAIAGLICVIIGIYTNYVQADKYGGTLSVIADWMQELKGAFTGELAFDKGFDAAKVFALLTLALCIVTVIATAITLVIRLKLIKLIALIVCILTIVSGAVAIICAYNLCTNDLYSSLEASPALGAWLLSIGGIVCGLGGAYVAVNR